MLSSDLLFLFLNVSSEMAFRFRIRIVNSASVVSMQYLCCCHWEPTVVGLYISADHCRERITSTKIPFISRLSHLKMTMQKIEFSYTTHVGAYKLSCGCNLLSQACFAISQFLRIRLTFVGGNFYSSHGNIVGRTENFRIKTPSHDPAMKKNRVSFCLKFIVRSSKRFLSPLNSDEDRPVQGPINREPDEKLRPGRPGKEYGIKSL